MAFRLKTLRPGQHVTSPDCALREGSAHKALRKVEIRSVCGFVRFPCSRVHFSGPCREAFIEPLLGTRSGAGADQMEIPVGADGRADPQAAPFPMAAVVLACLVDRLAEGEEARSSSSLLTDAVHDALAELATLLSDHLTVQTPFFDAGSRSVRIPDCSVLAAALGRGEAFLLLPVRRGRL